jgi:hypothetical protein
MRWKCMTARAIAVLLSAVSCAEPLRAEQRAESAQLPSPFGAPDPIIPGRQCSSQYQSLLKLQMEAFKQLQRLAQREGQSLCATLERADLLGIDKFIDPKFLEPLLTPQQRELLQALGVDLSKVNVARIMRLLGVDLPQIDLRQLKQQCQTSKSELDRFATNELDRLQSEISRCDDRV